MSTLLDTKIDIPLMLSRLAPTAEYHWRGNGYGLYSDIGEWRSPDILKPTEAEVYAEWDIYLLERDQHWAQSIQRAADFQAMVNTKGSAVISAINDELTLLNGTPTNAQIIAVLKANEQRQRAIIKALQYLADLLNP